MQRSKTIPTAEAAQCVVDQLHSHSGLLKTLSLLDEQEQSLLFNALGSNWILLITQREEFYAVIDQVKNKELFILYLFNHIVDYRQLSRILINFSLHKELFLLALTHPEQVEGIKQSIIKATNGAHDLLVYATQTNYYYGCLLIEFLGPLILTLGPRKEFAELIVKDKDLHNFVLNKFDEYQAQDNSWRATIHRGLSFFYPATERASIEPSRLKQFYQNESEWLLSRIVNNARLTDDEKNHQIKEPLRFASYASLARVFRLSETELLSLIINNIESKSDLIHVLNEHDLLVRIKHCREGQDALKAALREKMLLIIKTKCNQRETKTKLV